MQRIVQPELLDSLPVTDPLAIGSRRDLARVNGLMGNSRIIGNHFKLLGPLAKVAEIGGGDGLFLLNTMGGLKREATEVVIVDQALLLTKETVQDFSSLGVTAHAKQADVFEWLKRQPDKSWSVIVANLFLHHFEAPQLRIMFTEMARVSHAFVACEPRRTGLSLTGARLLGLIGCNAVTRHDAVISVRAGFAGNELTGLWPRESGCKIVERSAPPFSHFFSATSL